MAGSAARWMTSPFWDSRVEGTLRADLQFADCTLRDGEQQAGIVFGTRDKVDIAVALDRAGVHEIEAGTPAVSTADRAAIEEIVGLGLRARISALSRARADEIAEVAATGAWGVRLSLPISDLQRTAKLKLSDREYLDLAIESTTIAKEHGLAVIFSPFDTTRADLSFLSTVLGELSARGTVDRVRLVDTVGCATPALVTMLVGAMREAGDMEIEVHCHNDFGLAVANTLAGALAGAEHLSVTVNGIGERAGNAALEEVVMALRVLYDHDAGIDTSMLLGLSRLVEDRSAVALARHKAVVGTGAFAHESGMVVAGVLEDPFTAEPYDPALVGQQRVIQLGKKSGLVSLNARLAQLELDPPASVRADLLERVKDLALAERRAITDDELVQLVASATGTNGERR